MEKSDHGKTVYLEMGVWYNEDQGNIHIVAKGVKGFHTTVNATDDSKRSHPNLFMKLARCLRDAGAPYPKDKLDDLEGA